METHEFDITVNTDGTVRIHVQGAKGPACERYVEFFRDILKGDAEVERTQEYYELPTGVEINLGLWSRR